MRAHLLALGAHLDKMVDSQGKPWPHYLHRAEGRTSAEVPPAPYLILRGSWGFGELPICGETTSLDARPIIICVGGDVDAAGSFSDRVRRYLSPRSNWAKVPMSGRLMHVRVTGQTDPETDMDLRLPGTDRHPGVAHVLLHMVSDPA